MAAFFATGSATPVAWVGDGADPLAVVGLNVRDDLLGDLGQVGCSTATGLAGLRAASERLSA